jgi:hypothetical protein
VWFVETRGDDALQSSGYLTPGPPSNDHRTTTGQASVSDPQRLVLVDDVSLGLIPDGHRRKPEPGHSQQSSDSAVGRPYGTACHPPLRRHASGAAWRATPERLFGN